MQHEPALHFALLDIVHVLLVHLGAKRRRNDRLRFTACKERRAMNTRQPADLACDRTDLGELASVGTTAVAEHVFAEDLFLELAKSFASRRTSTRIILRIALDDLFL